MREWLTVIIVLLIVAVVLDGLRRMRQSRRSAIRMSTNLKNQPTSADEEIVDYGSELPSGGARVVNVRKAEDASERNTQIRKEAEFKRKNQLKSFRIPEQVSLNLDQQVPTLMESVEEPKSRSKNNRDAYQEDTRIEPTLDADDFEEHESEVDNHFEGSVEDSFENAEGNFENIEEETFDTSTELQDDFLQEYKEKIEAENILPKRTIKAQEDYRERPKREQNETAPDDSKSEFTLAQQELVEPVEPAQEKPKKVTDEPKASQTQEYDDVVDDYREPELVLTINVMAPKGQFFPGNELLDIILDQGMRFGAMNIFHRQEDDDGEGEILYSMANIVMPGTFDLVKMKTFVTPGVSFFMTLPMDANSTEAFEEMLTTAKIIGARLQGELKDENRSVLTPQTITHYRSKLQEFARKQLSKAPA